MNTHRVWHTLPQSLHMAPSATGIQCFANSSSVISAKRQKQLSFFYIILQPQTLPYPCPSSLCVSYRCELGMHCTSCAEFGMLGTYILSRRESEGLWCELQHLLFYETLCRKLCTYVLSQLACSSAISLHLSRTLQEIQKKTEGCYSWTRNCSISRPFHSLTP